MYHGVVVITDIDKNKIKAGGWWLNFKLNVVEIEIVIEIEKMTISKIVNAVR
jgi:hypothetical protein